MRVGDILCINKYAYQFVLCLIACVCISPWNFEEFMHTFYGEICHNIEFRNGKKKFFF